MKKIGFLTAVITILLMASCGKKTQGEVTSIDSTMFDSVMVADSVKFESSEIWTVEAVEAQIRACFVEVNKMASDDGIDITRLDRMFCSKDFLELQDELYKKVRENQVMFDGDDGHHWLAGIASPSTIDSIKAELLTGDQAQAEVWLKDNYGRKGYLKMNLYLENGAWKVHNWIDDDIYPCGALYNWMQRVLDGNTNDEEKEDSDLKKYAE